MTMEVYKWEAELKDHMSEFAGGSGKTRVAAYCRVSTEDQDSSYQAQKKHVLELMKQHPEWELVGIYADEGISGTALKHRREFLRMLRDCENRRIDMIVTKSVSRFARNTVDMLITIRRLREYHVFVVFEQENLDTSDLNKEMFLTLWASFAQAESVSISRNVVNALRGRMERGEARINCSASIGYEKTGEDKQIRIVPDHALIVRRIFREYLDGFSESAICDHLMKDGIPAPKGGETWHNSTVASILTNQKYMGDLLLQKTYTKDTLTHQIVENKGQLPQYYLPDHHDAEIPKEIYFRAQGERLIRAAARNTSLKDYRFSDPFIDRIMCGICGRKMRKVTFPDGTIEWRCVARASTRKTMTKENIPVCECPAVNEKLLRWAFLCAIARLPEHSSEMKASLDEMERDLPEEIRMVREQLSGMVHAEENKNTYCEKIELYAGAARYERKRLHLRTLFRLTQAIDGKHVSLEDTGEKCDDTELFYQLTDDLAIYAGEHTEDAGTAGIDWNRVQFHGARVWCSTPTGQTKHYENNTIQTRTGVWKIQESGLIEEALPELASDVRILRFMESIIVDNRGMTVRLRGGVEIELLFET